MFKMNNLWKNKILSLIRFYSIFSPCAIIIITLVWGGLLTIIPVKEYSVFYSINGFLLISGTITIIYYGIESTRHKNDRLNSCITELKQTNNFIEIEVLSGKKDRIKAENIKLTYSKEKIERFNPLATNTKILLQYIIISDITNPKNKSYKLFPELFDMEQFPITNWNKYNEVRKINYVELYP